MNGPSIWEVNDAVRAVLAGLGGAIGSEAIADRLVSARRVEALAEGVREIRVAPGTVITPLARDELKRRGVAVRTVGAEGLREDRGEWGFAVETRSGLAEALRRALLDGLAPWAEVGASAAEAARWVASRTSRGAAVIADEASVAAWRANRVPGVRAATVAEAGAVERAIRHLGANLVVIEPAGQSIFGMKHLLAVFRKGGAPRAPAGLEGIGHEDRRGDRAGLPVAPPPDSAERALRDRLAHAALGARGLLGRPR